MFQSTMKRGLFAALAALALAAMTPASAEPFKLRVSYDTIPTHLAPIIFKMPDQTKYFGKDYTIDFIRFKGSSLVLQALAADQVDVGVLAFSTFATGILNANLPIKGIADVAQDGPSFSTVYGVVAASPIKSVKDLKGQTIAVNAFGGAVDMAARSVLRKNGLTPDRDVRIIEAGFGAMEAMTKENKIQVGAFLAPFWWKAQKDGGIPPAVPAKGRHGNHAIFVLLRQGRFHQATSRRAGEVPGRLCARHRRGARAEEPRARAQDHGGVDRAAGLRIRRMGAAARQGHLSRSARPGERAGAAEQYRQPGRAENDSEEFDVRAHIDNSLVKDARKSM